MAGRGGGGEWTRERRFASFVERYMLARSSQFTAGTEREQAWATMMDARSMFFQIERMSNNLPAPETEPPLVP